MYRDKVFDEIRNELITKFQKIELEDFEMYHKWATPHYEILRQLSSLSGLYIPERMDVTEQEEKEEEETIDSMVEYEATYPIGRIFTISKKASGAVISELSYPIPEVIVREMGIENGNKVKITGLKCFFENGDPKWNFEIVDNTSTPAPGLLEINQGIVSKVGHTFIVNETISDNIIFVNDSPATLYINEVDSLKYNIKEGDIIDGRFYENNVVGSFRITYKYEVEESTSIRSVESRKLQYRKNNNIKTEAGTSMLERLDKQALLNHHIVLVGLESRKNDFSNNLKGFNEVKLTHLTGDESKTSIFSTLEKADYVLISTFENSHDASKYVAKACKGLDVPCTHTHSDGLYGILNDAIELINCAKK